MSEAVRKLDTVVLSVDEFEKKLIEAEEKGRNDEFERRESEFERMELAHAERDAELLGQLFDAKNGKRRKGKGGQESIGDVLSEVVSYDGAIEAPPAQGFILDEYIPENHVSILAAEGGAGKSTLAVLLAFSVALGQEFLGIASKACNVLYIDFELKQEDFERRGISISNGMGLKGAFPKGVYYWKPSKYMSTDGFFDEMRAVIHRHDIGFAIVDSFSMGAIGIDMIDHVGIIELYQQLANVGTTTLALDHVSLQARSMGAKSTPFGSAFKLYGARQVLLLEKDDVTKQLILHKGKSNFSGASDPIAYTMEFAHDEGMKGNGSYNVIRFDHHEVQAHSPHKKWADVVEAMIDERKTEGWRPIAADIHEYIKKKNWPEGKKSDRTVRNYLKDASREKEKAAYDMGNWEGLYRWKEGKEVFYTTWNKIGASEKQLFDNVAAE